MNQIQIECFVCKSPAQSTERDYGDKKKVVCPQCGTYEISKSLIAAINDLSRVKPYILSAYIRKQNDLGVHPFIATYDIDRIAKYPEPSLTTKIEILLLAYAEDVEEYTQKINVKDKKYIAKICAKNEQEYVFVLDILYSKGFVRGLKSQALNQKGNPFHDCSISHEGWIHTESLKRIINSTQGFVAMWFDVKMDSAWENGIRKAFDDTGYTPLRIDGKEHNNKIDDEIIAEIQRSRFLVADFTQHRGGVYFEAGYALGKGIPVIWTCRKDDLPNLHFDIRQYNTIDWLDENDLRERLHQRIRATIGEKI